LTAKLGLEKAISAPNRVRGNASHDASWVNEYLLGVVAECEAAASGRADSGVSLEHVAVSTVGKRELPDDYERSRLASQRALDHYHRFLEIHPDSFWGHYRAASVAYGLGGNVRIALAAAHLERCLEIRPDNPTLHHHRATCLMALDQNQEAQREVETAIERAPDVAEFYRTRATIRANLRQTGGLADDVRHFELLADLLHRSFWDRGPTDTAPAAVVSSESAAPFRGSFELESRLGDSTSELGRGERIGTTDPGEFDARVGLATAIRQAGALDLAEAEFNKLLLLEPDHIGVRMTRAAQAIEAGRLDQALPDIEAILRHPGLASYLRAEPSMFARMRDPNHRTLLELFNDASRKYCFMGKLDIGRAIARRAVDLAIELDQPRGMSHYTLARALADSAKISRSYLVDAAEQLYCAFVANPLYQEKYTNDATFDGVRPALDAALSRRNDPRVEYARRLAGTSPTRGR
jgi:tetratricopeptide (TPR) repeat protein